ncbi:14.7 kDa heat shock protein-like [Cornus florida]|uniref:14.7 kDa heat shock protein-like n=1 Tax=Cornus florida TaxID=4283 RepID=UPI00289D9E78|nr:14.7 kDa heat shock protein-like [Cornus florida]
MAFLSSSRALTRAHTLMNVLRPRIAAPFASARSFSTYNILGSDSNFDRMVDFHSKQYPNGEACSMVNQFLKEGSCIPHKVMKHEKAVYMRLDMPGIGLKGLKVWVDGNSLHVNGEEEVDKEHERKYQPRKYYGNIEIPKGCYKVEDITAVFKHGVLRIKVPKREELSTSR